MRQPTRDPPDFSDYPPHSLIFRLDDFSRVWDPRNRLHNFQMLRDFKNLYFCRKYVKDMAKIKRIVVHCTGEPSNVKRNREYYRHYFFDVRHWRHFGYHAVVYQDGTWEKLQPWPEVTSDGGRITDATTANGAAGYNSDSLHIAYVGGLTPKTLKATDTRTQEQKKTLWSLIACWKKDYKVTEVLGHSQLPGVKKACPCFDARTVYRNA